MLLLRLPLLRALCPIFYPVPILSHHVDVQFSHQSFGRRPRGLEMFGQHLSDVA